MSLLPAYIVDEEISVEEEEIETPREFGIDFVTGKLTGEIVEGTEAVKVWIYLALRIARYRFFILSWEYGNELEELYGQGYSREHMECEAREMIKDCLLANDYIEEVEITKIDILEDGKMVADISVSTIFEETIENEFQLNYGEVA